MQGFLRQAVVIAAAGTICAGATRAHASTIIDLGSNDSGSANGAYYQWTDYGPTGTGVINSFVRVQNKVTEQGYNHGLGNVGPWDTKSGIHTRDVQYQDLVKRTLFGIDYYEFLLDINESSGHSNEYLSLDNVQIFTRSSPITSADESLAGLGTQRFDSDAGGDLTVKLDYSRNHGSGSGDMFLYVPVANFAGALPGDYVYFYSHFGDMFGSDAGFEEWAMLRQNNRIAVPPETSPVPEPGTLMLFGTGLMLAVRKLRN
jgi:hypothetical protein